MSDRSSGPAVWVAVVGTVVGGIILLPIDSWWKDDTGGGSSAGGSPAGQQSPASAAPAAPVVTPVPAPAANPSPEAQPQAAPVPPPTPTPVPVDTQTITSARVEVVGRKLSPGTYSTTEDPGFYTVVLTAAGELGPRDGCYVHWELSNNGKVLDTHDTTCGLQGGWSTSYWPNGLRYEVGSAHIEATVTTDWGATASAGADFAIASSG